MAHGFDATLVVENRPERCGHAFTEELQRLENIALASAVLADQEQGILETEARREDAAEPLEPKLLDGHEIRAHG
jgi:hypothetical protein